MDITQDYESCIGSSNLPGATNNLRILYIPKHLNYKKRKQIVVKSDVFVTTTIHNISVYPKYITKWCCITNWVSCRNPHDNPNILLRIL